MNQEVINRAEDGTFRTKHLVCVVAAKSISMLFTTETDYSIRFTNDTPRQAANAPDAFEQEALAAFNADPERWKNCPDMMDCDPWTPPAPEPEEEAETRNA